MFMHGNIAVRYLRNHDKSTLRSACHAWQACMQRNRRFRHARVRAFPAFVWGLNRIIPFCGKSVQGMREEPQKTGSKRRKPGVTAIHPCQFHPAVTRNVTRGSSCTGTHFLLKWIRKAIRPDTRKVALGSDSSVPAVKQPKSPQKLDSFIHALIFIYFLKGGNDYG